MSFDFEWVYDEVIHHQQIAYTLTDGSKVQISFAQTEDGIKVVKSFEAETTHSTEMQRAGWQAILNNFKNHVEQN